jgi:hypothetical protein
VENQTGMQDWSQGVLRMKGLRLDVLVIIPYCLHLYTIDLVKMQGWVDCKALKVSRLGSHVLIETNLTKAQDSWTVGKAL